MPHRRATWVGVTFVILALMPAAAWAQATIAGLVRDSSGAVLPGVTVEASSDVLIEKVRTAITDGNGRYQIVDLRAGTYAVTFTLPGFSTVKREGIELTGLMTATVSADLRVGAVQETITVTGESPMVDVQSVRRQATITGEVLSTIPTARGYSGVMLLVPAIQTQGSSPANVQATPGMVVFGTPGGRNGNEGRLQVDGLGVGAARNGGGVSGYNADIANAQEISFTVSAGLGDAEVSGPSLSVVPEDGRQLAAWLAVLRRGQRRHGRIQLHTGAGGRGTRHAGPSVEVVGLHLRPWRPDQEGSTLVLPEPSQSRVAFVGVGHVCEPERGRSHEVDVPEGRRRDSHGPPAAGRSPVSASRCRRHRATSSTSTGTSRSRAPAPPIRPTTMGAGRSRTRADSSTAARPTAAPETATYENRFQRVQQLTWNSPVTNRVLLTAGFGDYLTRWGGDEMPGNPTRSLVRVTEQCAPSCPLNGGIPNLTYRSANWASHWMGQHNWNASMTYVTGAHNLKFGYQGTFYADDEQYYTNDEKVAYRLNNGTPNLITLTLHSNLRKLRTRYHARVRAGAVDDGPHDAAGRDPFRSRVELFARAGRRTDAVPADADRVPGDRGRRRLQRHLTTPRPGVRPLRQREDRAEGQSRAISRRCQ